MYQKLKKEINKRIKEGEKTIEEFREMAASKYIFKISRQEILRLQKEWDAKVKLLKDLLKVE